ncbi:hypothetical protein AB1K84_11305 [Mesobacillus foraminis]|uniref:Fur-regulated basic protein A n=1 Tax=Mesobacillus foraminis TaxID=279826 RepID=A0A4R2BA43_9BACI|nr:hypothetical protein [Mesobacillus foraminis]MBT2758708.1 hypothetical protein [Mesobacillus foraminis]TCN22409.1 hypothetical protein EV146_111252 [Mesobacillus foraminis]
MSNLLREGIEKARKHYIDKILKLKLYQNSSYDISHLSLTELQELFKKETSLNK